MIKKKTYHPNLFLSKYIDRFYTFERSDSVGFELSPILPGTGLEILFYIDTPLSVNGQKLEKGHIVCPRTISYFDKLDKVALMSVRFKSGAFRHFTSIPFSELNNSYLSIQDIWGDRGKKILYKLNNALEIKDKIKEIEIFLMDSFTIYHQEKNDKWDRVIEDLYYNFDNNTINELSKKVNISTRQLERNFKFQFGITAKEFQRITRFQNTIKKILLNKPAYYLDVVLDNGYFDQSHFIKEFKFFTDKTPGTYFTQESFKNHFYYESLKKI